MYACVDCKLTLTSNKTRSCIVCLRIRMILQCIHRLWMRKRLMAIPYTYEIMRTRKKCHQPRVLLYAFVPFKHTQTSQLKESRCFGLRMGVCFTRIIAFIRASACLKITQAKKFTRTYHKYHDLRVFLCACAVLIHTNSSQFPTCCCVHLRKSVFLSPILGYVCVNACF